MQSPNFDVKDIPKREPAYLSESQTSKEYFPENNMEGLQMEFEDNNSMDKKMEIFEGASATFQDKKSEKPKTDIMEKKKLSSGEKSNKKFKSSNNKAHLSTATSHQKNQITQHSKLPDHDFSDAVIDAPKVQKPDNPNRYWSFLDPYCAEITQDDIKTVEDWMESHEKDTEYQNIPSLGEHFTCKWIHEDMMEEMKEGSKSVECPKGYINDNSSNLKDKDELLEKAKNKCLKLQQPISGALTERLVSVLVEENLMTSLDEMNDVCMDDTIPKANSSKPNIALIGESLEIRLNKEFLNNGILEKEENVIDSNDELLGELKRIQSSLKPISEYNKYQKKKLLSLAKAEIKKQEVKMKLQECDAKVMEFYRAMAAARLKKKKLNRKEQEQIVNILKKRSNLTTELEKS